MSAPARGPRDVHVVTDIPSTYRIHLFRALRRALDQRDVELRVSFLARGQRNRNWSSGAGEFGFPHSFGRGPTLYLRHDLPVHINVGVWARTIQRPGTWLVLGGSWYHPAVLGSALFARPQYLLLWTENAERQTFSADSLVERVRQRALARIEGYVVPGERAEAHATTFGNHRAIRLPNTVDESLFRDRVAELRRERDRLRSDLGVGTERVLLWPTRLIASKGVLPFLEVIARARGEFRVVVAGDGVLSGEVAARAAAGDLSSKVRLLGKVDQGRMLDLYALSDVLLLPSLFDPYPLSTIEAAWAGLPLLLSDRVGSVPEILDGNGWVFDPADGAAAAAALEACLEAGSAELGIMGDRSRALASTGFDTATVAGRFAAELLEAFPV